MTQALVVGFGSAGQRHARILSEMGVEVGVVSRRSGLHQKSFGNLAEGCAALAPDYVVIANETTGHRESLQALRKQGYAKPVLVEKPLWASREAPIAAPAGPVCVGYNLRFHPALAALKETLRDQRVISAEIFCGSFLPDWRPGRDYRTTSSARRASGGGALHDLSHELDYAQWLFSNWTRLTALGGRISRLEIETDDVAMIMAETTRCPALSISLNYVERGARRGLIVNTDLDTLTVDLEAGTLTSAIAGLIPTRRFVLDDTYREQHQAVLEGRTNAVCSYQEGLDTVAMMAAIERAIAGKTWVSRDSTGGHA